MDLSKLKPVTNSAEIISIIDNASVYGGEIWQPQSITRKLSEIINIDVDRSLGYFTLEAMERFSFRPDLPLFVKLAYRNMIFKLDPSFYEVCGEKLFCNFPNEARAIEARKTPRYVLSGQAGISITLRRGERSVKEIVHDLEVRVLDASESGFAILVSGANKKQLNKYDYFWLKAIDQRPLNNHIFGTVSYVNEKGTGLKRGDVRIGLSLQSSLRMDILESLKRKSYLTLSA